MTSYYHGISRINTSTLYYNISSFQVQRLSNVTNGETAQRWSRMVSEGGESGEGSGASTSQDSQPDTVSETVPWQTIAPIDMWNPIRVLNDTKSKGKNNFSKFLVKFLLSCAGVVVPWI